MKKITAFVLAVLMLLGMMSVAVNAADAVPAPPTSKQNIKQVTYYDKNPDPNAANYGAENYPAVWMLYEDESGHDNFEVFALKEVASEDEAYNSEMGIKGYYYKDKWFRIIALWTVNPDNDIIDKGHGEKAIFTPLYYSEADKPEAGDTISVALYDYEDNAFSNLVDVVVPAEGEQTDVEVKEERFCTITVHYVYAEGGQAAPDVVEKYEIGLENYLINSPTIEDYTPDRNVVTGIPGGDAEFTVTYTKNLPDLSKAEVTGLSDTEGKKYTEEEVRSFGLEGLVKDEDYTVSVTAEESKWVVSFKPVEGKSTGEKVVKVEQEMFCTITVHYVYAEGGQAAPDVVEKYKIGLENYLINSPTIEDYTPDRNVVTGIPGGDAEFTVTYTRNATEPTVPSEPAEEIGSSEAPKLKSAVYDPESGSLKAEFTTKDVDSRYFEAFLLTEKDLAEAMGHFTIKSVVYSILGIQSFDSGDSAHVTVDKTSGKVTLSQELYFGKNEKPGMGETVYIAVQTEGKHVKDSMGEGSELSELKKIVVGEPDVPEKLSIKNAAVKVSSGGKYTGKAKKPAVTVSYDGKELEKGVDYTLSYSDNKNAGKAKVTVIGTGEYEDEITKTFKISKAENPLNVTVKKSVNAKANKKTTIKSAVKVSKAEGDVSYKTNNNKIKVKNGKLIVSKGLKKGKTYTVKVTVTAKGSSNYKSVSITKKVKVKIK